VRLERRAMLLGGNSGRRLFMLGLIINGRGGGNGN